MFLVITVLSTTLVLFDRNKYIKRSDALPENLQVFPGFLAPSGMLVRLQISSTQRTAGELLEPPLR
jgi:hypothetical protein